VYDDACVKRDESLRMSGKMEEVQSREDEC